jgi:hypothetical protein
MRIFPKRQKSSSGELNFNPAEFNPKIIGLNFEQGIQKGIFASRISYFSFWIVIGSLISQVALIVFSTGKLPGKIPIFYSLPWGESILAAAFFIWIIPILNFAFAAFDYFLINRYKDDKFLSSSLSALVVLICFICFYGTLKIIMLVK